MKLDKKLSYCSLQLFHLVIDQCQLWAVMNFTTAIKHNSRKFIVMLTQYLLRFSAIREAHILETYVDLKL